MTSPHRSRFLALLALTSSLAACADDREVGDAGVLDAAAREDAASVEDASAAVDASDDAAADIDASSELDAGGELDGATGESDAGAAIDAGADIDAGPADAGPSDAGPPDAGPPDAGPPDAGPPDAGPPDAGPPDAGPPDAGPPDAGPPDAGPADAGATTHTRTFSDSASVGTPDTYFINVRPGTPFRARITGSGGTWSVNVSDGTTAGLYCSDEPTCSIIVPAGEPTLLVTAVTTDIGYYTLVVDYVAP